MSSDPLVRLLGYLIQDFNGYPYDYEKDPAYFGRLLAEFPEIDIDDELRQYHAWVLDQPNGKKIYYRSRFRAWLKTAKKFRQESLVKRTPLWLRRRHAHVNPG